MKAQVLSRVLLKLGTSCTWSSLVISMGGLCRIWTDRVLRLGCYKLEVTTSLIIAWTVHLELGHDEEVRHSHQLCSEVLESNRNNDYNIFPVAYAIVMHMAPRIYVPYPSGCLLQFRCQIRSTQMAA
ncbi:hypothetical protein GGI43DRAFT_398377 [Trichoderma evansii]